MLLKLGAAGSQSVLCTDTLWPSPSPPVAAATPVTLSQLQAVEQKRKADDIAAVLYPNDATE